MTWVKFKEKNKANKGPTITLTKDGFLFFNSATFMRYLSEWQFIELYYDRENERIGFMSAEESSNSAYKIKKNLTNRGVTISAVSFCNHYEIEHKKGSVRRTAKWDEKSSMLYIDLQKNVGLGLGKKDD